MKYIYILDLFFSVDSSHCAKDYWNNENQFYSCFPFKNDQICSSDAVSGQCRKLYNNLVLYSDRL